MKILAINPGSTSTKVAIYEDDTRILVETIRHTAKDLEAFAMAIDQFEYRRDLVLETLEKNHIPLDFDATIGRGGLLKPIPGGVWEVNDAMLRDTQHAMRDHACNLGCLIACDLAKRMPGCKAFMADPGVVDEMEDISRISGSPLLPRITTWHALNQRAIARRFAHEQTLLHPERPVRYEDLDLIICHLGGGISVAAHSKGKAVDVNNAFDGEGPFSPERAGSLPAAALIDLCFSGRFTSEELKKRISGRAGLTGHLGTNEIPDVLRMIEEGDKHAELVLEAMLYQVAKWLVGLSAYFCGHLDAILLTGGMAHSEYIITRLKKRISFLAPVYVYPGEDEMEAMALNALGALRGTLLVQKYQ